MLSRSSCAKIATVRSSSSVPARKMRTAISLRLAAISFLMGCTLGVELTLDLGEVLAGGIGEKRGGFQGERKAEIRRCPSWRIGSSALEVPTKTLKLRWSATALRFGL